MPFGTVKKKREAVIILRILPEEKTAIAGEASKAGMTVSEYIRRRALDRPVYSRVSEKAINELRRLGGLQKHLATKYQHKRDAIDEVLVEIKSAIQRLDQPDEVVASWEQSSSGSLDNLSRLPGLTNRQSPVTTMKKEVPPR